MRRRWDDPQIQSELAAQSARGLSAGQIARQMGASTDAVKSAMTRYGLFASSKARPISLAKSAADHRITN